MIKILNYLKDKVAFLESSYGQKLLGPLCWITIKSIYDLHDITNLIKLHSININLEVQYFPAFINMSTYSADIVVYLSLIEYEN